MENLVDFYLGSFLILCGFVLSLLNLRRIMKTKKVMYPAVLLSENILLICIGIGFICKSINELSMINSEMTDIEERAADIMNTEDLNCNITSIIMSYGPFIVSIVNSFVSLIIDNYMHYKFITDIKKSEDQNEVREFSDNNRQGIKIRISELYTFFKKYLSVIAVVVQWLMPILIVLPMYTMDVKEMTVMDNPKGLSGNCMALLEAYKDNCSQMLDVNETLQLRQYLPQDYLEIHELELFNTTDREQVDQVVGNVYKILADVQNRTYNTDINMTSTILFREPKVHNQKCMKVCYIENKKLLLYVFGLSIVNYFVPITISTIILTKIHMTAVKNQNVKTYINRELFYNILFWTPVMFDTFLSITLCSYTMNGMRTSVLNVIANVYQAVKNFMNTKHFKTNTVVPV